MPTEGKIAYETLMMRKNRDYNNQNNCNSEKGNCEDMDVRLQRGETGESEKKSV
jgi:hypothetical protein